MNWTKTASDEDIAFIECAIAEMTKTPVVMSKRAETMKESDDEIAKFLKMGVN